MAFPLIPIVTALAAGGTLVPHAAGGMIVTAAGGYVAGTYLSTVAIGGVLAVATAAVGSGLALAVSAAKGVIGASLARAAVPTLAGTATLTGGAASAGVVSLLTAPVWLSLTTGGVALGLGYGVYRIAKLKQKATQTPAGVEAQFSDADANLVELVIKRLAKQAGAVPSPGVGGQSGRTSSPNA